MAEQTKTQARNLFFENEDPLGTLKVLSGGADTTVPPSKQMADALLGKGGGEGEGEGEGGFVGPTQAGGPGFTKAGEPIPKTSFQKGLLKGADKSVFFGMLADTLSAIGGRPDRGFTRQAIEVKNRRQALAQRQEEVVEARSFEEEQRKLDREARAEQVKGGREDKALDREAAALLAQRRIDSENTMVVLRHALEQESLDLRAKHGINADAVAEVFDDVSTFEGLRFPPHITPEAAFSNPAVLEEARRLVAPFKQRRVLMRLDKQSSSMAKEQARLTAEFQRATALWTNGQRMASQNDVAMGTAQAEGQLLDLPAGPLDQRIALTVAALGPAEVMNERINAGNRVQVIDALVREFQTQGGGPFFGLDLELQRLHSDLMAGQIGQVWDAVVASRREEIRELNLGGKLQAPIRQEPVSAVRPGAPKTQAERIAEIQAGGGKF